MNEVLFSVHSLAVNVAALSKTFLPGQALRFVKIIHCMVIYEAVNTELLHFMPSQFGLGT